MTATVELIPVLDDNYAYVLKSGDDVAVIDPGEAGPVLDYLKANNLTPRLILDTHHHGDHIAGQAEIKAAYGCKVIGPRADAHRIKDMDEGVGEGDAFAFGDETVKVFETPGHTSGHIAFYLPESGILFCGDTLFSMNMGYIFEGTPEQMWASISKLRALPDDTKLYCGHEYTHMGLPFAEELFGDAAQMQERAAEVRKAMAEGAPTLPSTIGREKASNAYVNADNPNVRAALGAENATPPEMLDIIRERKSVFDEKRKTG